MNPKHFHVRTKPDDGTIWLTYERYRQAIVPIKDITNDVLLCLCADLSADNETKQVERSVRFSDGFACKITVEVIPDAP
jgi:uncharacterized protein (DUF849 family)